MGNGWTQERRARQAALIRTWRPWERSTEAKTAACKARSSRNADKPESFNRQIREIRRAVAELTAGVKEFSDLTQNLDRTEHDEIKIHR
jgi:hypothetical protein